MENMSFRFDFAFDIKGAGWNEAYLALLFAAEGTPTDLGRVPGPLAVAHASRYVELFEMQVGASPMDVGLYCEAVGGENPIEETAKKAQSARARGMIPIIIAEDRKMTRPACAGPLVALWGKVGRTETSESELFATNKTILAGVRAATSQAFKSIPADVTILTARGLCADKSAFVASLAKLADPVHLSMDIDVLTPGTAQNNRCLEPGGLSWYDLCDLIDLVIEGPGLASAELIGTRSIKPKTPSAVLCAQILLKLTGMLTAGLEK